MVLFSFLCSYLRSPDGACLLTNSDDNTLRIFNLPTELYGGNAVQGLSEMVFNNVIFVFIWIQVVLNNETTDTYFSTAKIYIHTYIFLIFNE